MNIKQELTWGTIGSIIIIFLTIFFANNYSQLTSNTNIKPNISSTANQNLPTANAPQKIVLTPDIIAKHNTEKDCWIIIDNNVYDVTNYLFLHPGGASIIVQYCGGDATTGYNTKGGKGSHSFRANTILKLLLLGSLKGPVVNQSSEIQKNILQIPQQKNRGEKEEDD